jgi:hypothetical protein
MEGKDLVSAPPRRWDERLGDVRWLPRLIDKAAAALSGTLGNYLYGQSPMDSALLRQLGLTHREFAVFVKNAGDDAAVLAALSRRDPAALARARAWSDALPERHKYFLWFLDVDDGYRTHAWLHKPVAIVANALSKTAKRLWPSRAAERAASTADEIAPP